MKKMIITLIAMMVLSFTSARAMSYEQARQQALFLTDKMAYELNLTDDQYEAAYEVNLDYLMGVNGYDDLYGVYWRQRNMDLSYILLDWQYNAYLNASYFYRPLYWDAGCWHFGIYARYPRRDYFFFGRPNFYVSYRGGHSWRVNGGRSWYHGRQFGAPGPDGERRMGMRDGFNRGDFGRGRNFGSRQSSTRNTVTRDHQFDNRPSMDRRNNNGQNMNRGNDRQNENRQFGNRSFGNNNRQFGNSNDRPSRDFGGSRNNGNSNRSSIFNGNRSFGGGNNNSPSKNFTPRSSTSSPNLGGGSHMGGGNRGGGSFGGGNRGGGNNGGGHFGNRR